MFIKYKKKIMYLIVVFIILAMSLFFSYQNNAIVITQIDYSNSKIPGEFEGYKIVHISDLHNKAFGSNQENLLKKIQRASPDIIVVTGDLIDRRKYDLQKAMLFVNGAIDIAPIYYVSGNHEAWSGDYENIKQQLEEVGVQVLDNTKIQLAKGPGTIEILGLSDPDFLTSNYRAGTNSSRLQEQLISLADDSSFQILLSHRPELFNIYVQNKIGLIFSGHAHGGQVRLPFIGGLVAPDQGFLPQYTSGTYTKNESTLVVSRGLGNSIIPVRIFNRPEIIVITFSKISVD